MIEKENIDNIIENPLFDAAVSMHELYTSFLAAGFNEEQSMEIIIGLLAAKIVNPPQNNV